MSMNNKVREYIVKITGLAYDVNSKTNHDVFVDFAGHVDSITVRVDLGGWNKDKDEDYKWSAYFDKPEEWSDGEGTPDQFEKTARDVIHYLKELLET